MSVNVNEERELDWDDEIENDSPDFILLAEGEYPFEVYDFERDRHPGSEKLPPCNKAVLKLKVFGENGESVIIKHNLFLHGKTEGLICAFFTAIGHRKHGEKLKMNWNKAIGCRGRAKIGIRKYKPEGKEERQYNEVLRFFDPPENEDATGRSYTEGDF
jgi:hypothetical protein